MIMIMITELQLNFTFLSYQMNFQSKSNSSGYKNMLKNGVKVHNWWHIAILNSELCL